MQPGFNGEVGLWVVGDDEHMADGTAGGVRERLQVDLGRGHRHATNGGDPGDVCARHPGLRDRSHEQRPVDLCLGTARHHDDVGAQPIGCEAQILLGAVHDEHGGDRESRDAEGAQTQQLAPQLVPAMLRRARLVRLRNRKAPPQPVGCLHWRPSARRPRARGRARF